MRRARHLSAVPQRATYHPTARGTRDSRWAHARTAVLFEIEPPLNVTAPSFTSTTPPPPSCAQADAATPVAIGRRTPSADTRPNCASPH
jgi:hypothetical protein